MKKLLLLPIIIAICIFTRIDSFYATGNCVIQNLDTSINGTTYGYTRLDGNTGNNESNYGLTTGSGQWAVEFSWGTVWGMANCNSANGGSRGTVATITPGSSGQYCWCQVTGFTASGNSYTSGPQCSITTSSSWVFDMDLWWMGNCNQSCASDCTTYVKNNSSFRDAMFVTLPTVLAVDLAWYDGNSTITGPSSCTVGGTFLPPTPPARPGYVFTGWKAVTCADKIKPLDTSINGTSNACVLGGGAVRGNASNYGLNNSISGQWAVEFSYGTVWGKSKCSATSGDNHDLAWGAPSSDWLKTPSSTSGQYCWCQVTGFTASGNSYTSGPQCSITTSSSWVFVVPYNDGNSCESVCMCDCVYLVQNYAGLRNALFNAAGQ